MTREQRIADGALDVICSWGVEEWELIADALEEAVCVQEVVCNRHYDNGAIGSPQLDEAVRLREILAETAEEIRMEVLCDD